MTLPTEYNESIELFKKTFDVPKLCYEILSLIKHPAKEGKLYDVEVVSAKFENFKVSVEFRTNEETYFTMNYNLQTRLDAADEFLGRMGTNTQKIREIEGKKFKVFYQDMFNCIILN